jgi:hypothetical protein
MIWAGLAVLAAGVATAQSGAWPEMPSHKTYISPAYFPKSGQTDFTSSGSTPGAIQARMESLYEGFFRETSYYRANPTNGLNVRGYFMDSRVGGEVAMPWAWNPPSNAVAPSAWTNFSAAVGDPGNDRFADGRGEHFDELADKLTPAVLYRRYNAATTNLIDDPLVDGFWTPGERFTDRGGTAAPNGRWDDYVHAEDRWTPVHSNTTISAGGTITNTTLSADLLGYVNSSVTIDGTAYAKGDLFYDYDSSIRTVSTNTPSRVLTYSSMATTNAVIWVADRDRTLNVPVRISEFDLTPPLYFNSSPTVISTNVYAEDRWLWSPANRVLSGTGALVLSDPVKSFLSTPDVGDVIADYDFSINISSNTPGTRVNSGSPLASSNALFYIANLTSGTNIPFRLNELDLVPPVFFIDQPSGSISTVPAEDRWTPTHDFTGIASTMTEFLPIRTFLDSTVGDAILDYDFSCYPEYEYWNLGVTNITIWVADTSSGTNRPVVVNQLDLTPPRYFQSGIPYYGRRPGGTITSDPSPNLEGDAGHLYLAGTPPGAYTNVARTGRLEVDYVNDPLYGSIPSMNASSLAVTVRVYFVSAIIQACTNAPGTVIRYPDPIDSNNRFVYTNGRVQVVEKDFDFWSACVDRVGTPAKLDDWSEVSIPLYTASPIWGQPSNTNGIAHYTNTASVAGALNPFEDATLPPDDVWTPSRELASSFVRTPVYGYAGGEMVTNGPNAGYDGDASHTYFPDPANPAPAYASVARLGRFEYQVNAGLRPYVYLSGQGITLQSFIPATVVTNCLNNSSNVYVGCQYIPSENRIVVVDNTAFKGISRTAPVDRNYPAHVTVPLYYSTPMWGKPVNPAAYTNAAADINNLFEDATVPKDDVWTPGTNYILGLTGGNLVPNYGAGGSSNTLMEGDAAWTYVRDTNAPPPNLNPLFDNVGFLSRLEYNLDAAGLPHVYQSPRQYEVVIFSYANLPTTFFDSLLANPGVELGGYVFTNARVRVLNPPPNFLGDESRNDPFFVANDETLSGSGMTRVQVAVHVPLYHSIALWGAPQDAVNFTNPPSATIGINNPFLDAVGRDGRPTAAVPAEAFSDFISWWDPTGGRSGTGVWVPGLVGVPTNSNPASTGVLPRGSTPTPDYWSYDRYTNYIANNYPGDVAGLIARCGDLKYDGPETWAESGENNQMIQRGFLTGTSSPTPSQSQFWDFTVGPPSIRSYSDWWMDRYGRYGTTQPTFESRIPNMSPWVPVADANQVVPTTTQTVITASGPVVVLTYGSINHPPTNSTWTYDSPREFDDLASSMYHNPDLGSRSGQMMRNLSYRSPAPRSNPQAVWDGGDMRLGEETCPFGGSIYGMDRGDNNPSSADLAGDGSIPACGPYAYHTHANTGYDAANQLNLEFSTWRTDGQSLTGPRGGHRKTPGYDCNAETYGGYHSSITYARDHRDVTLNGLIDQGETLPAGSYNYFQDADPVTIDNGMDTMPLLGWERCVEDMVDSQDETEDFGAITRFTLPPGRGAEEWGIITPSGYVWREGAAALTTLSNVVGAAILYADADGSGDFTPHVDALWIDSNGDKKFNDIEPIIHGFASDQEMPSGVGPVSARWADLNGNGVYDINIDLVWVNTSTAGEPPVKFNSEPVLHDATGKLKPGDGNAILSAGLRARDATTGLIRNIYVYPAVTNFTLMWAVNNAYAGPTEIYYGSSNGVDLIYAAYGVSHPAMTTTGVLWTGASAFPVRYVCRTSTDPGYQPGDDVFIDANNNGFYDADRIISGPSGSLPLNSSGQVAQASPLPVGYTTNGVNTTFQRDFSVAWLEQNPPFNARSREYVLFQSLRLTNGTAGLNISSKIQLTLEGGVFYDANGDGLYAFGETASIPLYVVGMLNGNGIRSPSPFIAGQHYGAMTRDGYISGYNQNQPANINMPNPVILTHEQCHDVLGWPDLYDYDRYTGDVVNSPTGGGDLMADGGGLMHGYPDLKLTFGVQQQSLNYGASPILRRNGGPRTVLMYPVERFADQYYVFQDVRNPGERYILNFNAGSLLNTVNPNNEQVSPYANPIGRGLVISKSDDDAPQQRGNRRFKWLYIQADGKYELEDGVNNVEQADAFGMTPTTRQFTAQTTPAAVWFDGTDSGLRILDIRIPTDPYAPAQVDIEWVSTTTTPGDPTDWYWVPSGVDSDGDGIPDAWEYYWFGRYPNPLAMVNRLTDFDGDGLTDYEEWLLHSNPIWQSSWESEFSADPVSDADADIDGDGLSNRDELRVWNTNPRDIDSDDDGILDGAEVSRDIVKPGGRRLTDPAYSRSPLIQRALRLTAANSYLLPEQSTNMPYALNPITDFTRLQLTNWTVEAWVWLNSAHETGSVVSRTTLQDSLTFSLAISNNHPYATFRTMAGITNVALAPDAITASNWVHIAGTYDQDAKVLKIYVDGELKQSKVAFYSDVGHPGYIGGGIESAETRLGGGLNGIVDEVRIWSRARAAVEIEYGRNKIVNSPWRIFGDGSFAGASMVNDGSLVVNLRFDDQQNLTNRMDYGLIAFGAEDWVHAGNWNYAVQGMLTSQFVTNTPPKLVLTESLTTPYDDLNEDGIPDWWQRIYWPDFDPFDAGLWDAANDADSDGLPNTYEYILDLNPLSVDTDPGTPGLPGAPGRNDLDGDGLADFDEVVYYGTDPANPDTDDDGIGDGREILAFTSPLYSRSPEVPRSAALTGLPLIVPEGPSFTSSRFSLPAWTVEFWVKLDQTNTTGSLMSRVLAGGAYGGFTNWAVVVSNNVPYTWFQTRSGNRVLAGGGAKLPTNQWTHIASVFNPERDTLELIVNGTVFTAQATLQRPATGLGHTTIGDLGIRGKIDEIRVWNLARTRTEIGAFAGQFMPWSDEATLAAARMQRDLLERIRLAPGQYRFYAGTAYELITTPMTYSQAVDHATSLGGRLASINSPGENAFVTGLARDEAAIWTGLSDEKSEGNWVWADGTTLADSTYVNWETWRTVAGATTNTFTEPDGGAAQNHAALWPQADPARAIEAGGWFDADGRQPLPFVVEYDAMAIDGLVAWYVFDDGTTNTAQYGAEDFIHLLDDRYAIKNVTFTTNDFARVTGFEDLDQDGLPDWWERLWFGDLSPTAADDSDADGISNQYEYYIGTNPSDIDTDNDGVLDTDEDFDGDGVSNADELLLGSDPLIAYAGATGDKDYTEDWWEDQYDNAAASSLFYDSQRDWDEDGWDNWSEARYEAQSGVTNQPDSGVTAPAPQLAITVHYPGLSRGAVVVLAYSDRAMDGDPDATFTCTTPASYPLTIPTNTVTVSGRLRQGSNWFFAMMDLNGNGGWDQGEPAGLADRFPYDVGWDQNAISFTLTDKPVNGFVRLALPTVTGTGLHSVDIGRITWSGTNAIFTRVFFKSIRGPRNWLHEGDILDPNAAVGGGKPGLDWDGRIPGTPTIPIGTTSTYEYRVDGVSASNAANYFAEYYLGTTLPTPVAEYPRGAVVSSPRPEFRWTMTPYASAFELQILTTNASPVVVYSSGTNAAPPMRNADPNSEHYGLRVWSPPIHWGDIVPALNGGNGVLTNAAFRWRVRAFQPRLVTGFSDGGFTYSSSISAYSSSETVRINLSDTIEPLGSINVRVGAAYLPSNACIRVQAFETGSLNDLPVVQRTLLNVGALPRTVTLNGLDDQKSYYIAAYVDQITDNSRATWESWGYYRSLNRGLPWHFQPLTEKAAKGSDAPTVTVMIRSVDTDQDEISDSYEYAVAGGLGGTPVMPTGGVEEGVKPLNGEFGWLDVLGLASGSTVDDPVYRDYDRDGMNDKQEFDLGLSGTAADELRITGLGADNQLEWTLTSAAGAAGTLSTTTLDVPVTYVLERTDSLATPDWIPVAEVGSKEKAGAFDLGTDRRDRPAGFYRLRVVTP